MSSPSFSREEYFKFGFVGEFITRKRIGKFCVRFLPHPPAGGSSLPEGALGCGDNHLSGNGFPRGMVCGPLRVGAPAKRVGENAGI